MRGSQLHGDADAVDGRGEATEEELLFGLREDLVEARTHGALGGRVAGAIDVGGVLQQAEDALLAKLGKGVPVEGLGVGRREVDLEVAGVDDHADRSVNGERHAVHQRVGDANGHDGERPEGEAATGKNLDQFRVLEQAVLFQLAFHKSEGELGAVDRDIELGEDPGEAADVVLVAVGEYDGADFIAVLSEIADIGDHNVDAKQLFFGKHQAGIDDDNVILPPEGQTVHTELPQAPEGDHA